MFWVLGRMRTLVEIKGLEPKQNVIERRRRGSNNAKKV